MTQQNPLAKHFRIPGVHVRLPSQGRFMPAGSVELTVSGEVPILPMRAADELLLKSADALLNGYAIEKLIESCAPSVHAVRELSVPDVDVVLLAIRVATYGKRMTVGTTCPKCQEVNEVADVDVSFALDSVVDLEPEYPVTLSDEVTVFVRPYNLGNSTQANLAAYQETQKLKALQTSEASDDEKTAAINHGVERLSQLSLMLTGDCVMRVVTPDGEVTNKAMIGEFIREVPGTWVAKISACLEDINKSRMDKTLPVTCGKCAHVYESQVEFNPANFFAPGF